MREKKVNSTRKTGYGFSQLTFSIGGESIASSAQTPASAQALESDSQDRIGSIPDDVVADRHDASSRDGDDEDDDEDDWDGITWVPMNWAKMKCYGDLWTTPGSMKYRDVRQDPVVSASISEPPASAQVSAPSASGRRGGKGAKGGAGRTVSSASALAHSSMNDTFDDLDYDNYQDTPFEAHISPVKNKSRVIQKKKRSNAPQIPVSPARSHTSFEEARKPMVPGQCAFCHKTQDTQWRKFEGEQVWWVDQLVGTASQPLMPSAQ